ncbi:double-strand break repair helicase AddA [Kiloniella sp. b19]|uniref:double-strand break repair helicase AddA n=1 Tax=Kiloniella sp. GXU_MW_B19 TaxID=3141326 RepID=UPI0031D1C0BB
MTEGKGMILSARSVEEVLKQATRQQREAADPKASVWVGASAGTGKTKVLTDRVLTLLLSGMMPDRLLCLTFTKAAAAEMSNRLASRLAEWATAQESDLREALQGLLGEEPSRSQMQIARQLFARVLDTPGGMKIQTIHAFCQSLLGRFPLEAGVAPNFQVLDDARAEELLQDAIGRVLSGQSLLSSEEVSACLAALISYTQEESFRDLLKNLLSERARLARLLRITNGLEGLRQRVFEVLDVDPQLSESALLQLFCSEERVPRTRLEACASALEAGGKTDKTRAESLRKWLSAPEERRANLYDSYRSVFLTADGEARAERTMASKGAREAMPDVLEELYDLASALLRFEDQRRAVISGHATLALLTLGEAILGNYEKSKQALSLLDYDDLILKTRDLFAGGAAAWVMFKLDGGLDHILIDEAQDTNPEQWEVIRALCEEFFAGEGRERNIPPEPETGGLLEELPRTVFVVGDAKQSIYSFQRADPDVFEQMQREFQARVESAAELWKRVNLAVSFRSTAAVLSAVDDIFAEEPASEGVLFAEDRLHHQPKRLGEAGQVEVWPLVQSAKDPAEEPWALPLERSKEFSARARLASILAKRIYGWTRDPQRGDDPDCQLHSKGRRIEPGDVLILVRRRNAFVDELIRELKELGVPVAGIDRMQLSQQISVMDLLALGRFLLLPDDDLTLAEVLKSPLIGWDDELLFQLAHGRGKGITLWSRLRDAVHKPPEATDRQQRGEIERAYAFLMELLSLADQVPPFELYARVLGPLKGRERLLARLGPDAGDPLEEFVSLTLQYEQEDTPSLQGFLNWLDTRDVEIKRDLEQGSNAVRIMTVHGSKGLQAPVVIAPDTADMPQERGNLFWLRDEDYLPLWAPNRNLVTRPVAQEKKALGEDRMREYRRLLYVALTRAEDRLVICGWSKAEEAKELSWYGLCYNALADSCESISFSFPEDPASAWEGEGLLRRVEQTLSVEPVSQTVAQDPSGQQQIRLPVWADKPPAAEPVPPKPLVPSQPLEDEPAVRSPLLRGGERAQPVRGARLRAFQRGRLVHRLLQSLPDIDQDRWEQTALRFLSSPLHGLDAEEAMALSRETLQVLRHPDFAEFFGPDSRAEVPLTGLVYQEDGRVDVISGQVDRLLVQPDRVVVLDFKTNRPPPQQAGDVQPVYLRQLALYKRVLMDLYPGRRIECCLVWTDETRIMPIPDDLMTPFLSGTR